MTEVEDIYGQAIIKCSICNYMIRVFFIKCKMVELTEYGLIEKDAVVKACSKAENLMIEHIITKHRDWFN